MVMQNVTMNASAMTVSTADRSTFTKKSSQSNFDLLLGNCAGSGKSAEVKSDTKTTAKTGQEKADNTAAVSTDYKAVPKKTGDILKGQLPEEQADDQNNAVYISAVAEQIMAMFNQIRNAITEALNITDEELSKMMEELGLDNIDLLDMQAIKSLVLYNSGNVDATVLLLDEQVGETFKNLTETLDKIIKEANIGLTRDEIEQITKEYGIQLIDQNDANEEILAQFRQDDPTENNKVQTEKETVTDTAKVGTVAENSDNADIIVNKAKDSNANQAEENNKDENLDLTDGFEAFLNRLEAGYENSIGEFSEDTVRLTNIKEIAREIIEQVRIMAKPGQTTMELQLYPEHLGKVNLTISSNAEGVLSARFIVQNESAKAALEGQMVAFKENLAQQGIKVESIEVTIAGYSFEQNGNLGDQGSTQKKESGSGRKITFEEAVAMSEEPAEESTPVRITGVSGHNIDYTA